MKLTPYWQDSAPGFTGGTEGPVAGKVDAVIVGGGFTGLSAALALARKGASVVVLEAGRVIGEASGRNGGQCNNGLAGNFAETAEKLGLDRARALYHTVDDAVDSVERLVREERISCHFHRGGKIKLAYKSKHYDAIAKGFALLHQEADAETHLVTRNELRREIGSDAFHGGLIYRKSAQMHMGQFGVGLAEAARRRGARIYENAPVTRLQRLSGTAHRVTCGRGVIEAAQLLLATGTSRRGPFFFRRRIIPVGSFVVATEALSAAQVADIMPTRRTATTTRHIGNYFRIAPDNRLIWGGRARFALSSPESDAKSGRVLQAQLHRVFPQLGMVRIDYCWGGVLDLTADRLPRAGEQDGVFYAMGYSGHGTQMSVHMGQRMAEVMDGHPQANPLRDLSWPAIPGHFGPPWFMPIVGAYYRLQDWLN
jgi:glycine/D-amino acid oxidase-like deaminating enzyme